MAEWVEFAGREKATEKTASITVYTDPDTIIKTGNMVKIWSLTDYKKTEEESRVTSARQKDEYDCKEKKHRILFIAFYTGHMGKGETVLIDNERGDWHQPLEGSLDKAILDFACRFRPKLPQTFTNMSN